MAYFTDIFTQQYLIIFICFFISFILALILTWVFAKPEDVWKGLIIEIIAFVLRLFRNN